MTLISVKISLSSSRISLKLRMSTLRFSSESKVPWSSLEILLPLKLNHSSSIKPTKALTSSLAIAFSDKSNCLSPIRLTKLSLSISEISFCAKFKMFRWFKPTKAFELTATSPTFDADNSETFAMICPISGGRM